jgi:uncharacterized protein (TIGR02145 family)
VFTGTPPYDLVLKSTEAGTHTYTYSINDNYYNLHKEETIQSFSDKTGAPGIIIEKCHDPGATEVTFAKFNPCAGAPYGSTYTLTDDRDGKPYKVKYTPDGRWWMVQDLAFGEKCETKSSLGNLTTAGNITTSGTYYGGCYKINFAGAGYGYNNTAAMNYGTGATPSDYTCSGTYSGYENGYPATCRGICPEGWHIPTKDEITVMFEPFASDASCRSSFCYVDYLALPLYDMDQVGTQAMTFATSETDMWYIGVNHWSNIFTNYDPRRAVRCTRNVS